MFKDLALDDVTNRIYKSSGKKLIEAARRDNFKTVSDCSRVYGFKRGGQAGQAAGQQ